MVVELGGEFLNSRFLGVSFLARVVWLTEGGANGELYNVVGCGLWLGNFVGF